MASTDIPEGLFVAFEGIDGTGTTTQAARLAQWLRAEGHTTDLTCEPTDGPVGLLLREAIAQGGDGPDEYVMALLFAADRVDHLKRHIVPTLNAGRNVVSDRYVMSSLAYQSAKLDIKWVWELNRYAQAPDVTVLLDAPADVCLQRLLDAGRGSERYENTECLEQIRLNYRRIASKLENSGEHVEVLDAAADIEELHRQIVEIVSGVAGLQPGSG